MSQCSLFSITKNSGKSSFHCLSSQKASFGVLRLSVAQSPSRRRNPPVCYEIVAPVCTSDANSIFPCIAGSSSTSCSATRSEGSEGSWSEIRFRWNIPMKIGLDSVLFDIAESISLSVGRWVFKVFQAKKLGAKWRTSLVVKIQSARIRWIQFTQFYFTMAQRLWSWTVFAPLILQQFPKWYHAYDQYSCLYIPLLPVAYWDNCFFKRCFFIENILPESSGFVCHVRCSFVQRTWPWRSVTSKKVSSSQEADTWRFPKDVVNFNTPKCQK